MQQLQFCFFPFFQGYISQKQGSAFLGASVPWEVFDNETLYANPDHMLGLDLLNKAGTINGDAVA